MNIKQMMKQAQQMQAKLAREMEELRVEGTAGGGAVKVTLTGNKQVAALVIDPAVVAAGDVEMLQDMVVAAFNDAGRQVDETLSTKVGGQLPGF